TSALTHGTLVFAVSRFLMAGLTACLAYLFDQVDGVAHRDPAAMPTSLALLVIGTAVFSLWAFRYLWFYIPAALSYELRSCVRALKGFGTSIYMILTAIVCFLPVTVLQYMIASL